jgi:hypothetical protein
MSARSWRRDLPLGDTAAEDQARNGGDHGEQRRDGEECVEGEV